MARRPADATIDHVKQRIVRLPRPARHLAALAVCMAAVTAAACNNGGSLPDIEGTGSGSATQSPTASGTATEPASTSGVTPVATPTAGVTETATASATQTAEPDPLAQLRRSVLSNLTTGLDPASVMAALENIEVITIPLPAEGRELVIAVTSGSGIYDFPQQRDHVAAALEYTGEDWVELSNTKLGSAPTFADIEIVTEDHEGAAWIAIHGGTGAHSGTFELLRFDGVRLSSSMWWFSPMPGAGAVADLDGQAPPEIVLNATDPYVYCYACGVRAWNEVIYRWSGPDLVEVRLGGVAHPDPRVTALTEAAATFARADLWRRALNASTQALNLAPDHPEVWWQHTLISRVAEARLDDAGAEPQPFMTYVLAGEYEAAVDLMRPYLPERALAADGPLLAGTIAGDGWESTTSDWVLDYTARAIPAAPDLAAAHAVRAFGLLLAEPADWNDALEEMEQALNLAPDDEFYREAFEYLLTRATAG